MTMGVDYSKMTFKILYKPFKELLIFNIEELSLNMSMSVVVVSKIYVCEYNLEISTFVQVNFCSRINVFQLFPPRSNFQKQENI